MPERPSRSAASKASSPCPLGATTPIPVITTRFIPEQASNARGRGQVSFGRATFDGRRWAKARVLSACIGVYRRLITTLFGRRWTPIHADRAKPWFCLLFVSPGVGQRRFQRHDRRRAGKRARPSPESPPD